MFHPLSSSDVLHYVVQGDFSDYARVDSVVLVFSSAITFVLRIAFSVSSVIGLCVVGASVTMSMETVLCIPFSSSVTVSSVADITLTGLSLRK